MIKQNDIQGISKRGMTKYVAMAQLSLILLLTAVSAHADDSYNGYNTNQNYGYSGGGQNLSPLQGRVVTAPQGSTLSATLQSPISSEYARVGDRFNASLGSDLISGGSLVLPAGSQLEAQVVSVTKAGRAGRDGQMDVRFTSAILPNGQRVPFSGKIQTDDGTGLIKGGATAGRLGRAALKTGLGAGLGAALGTAMGPLSGGSVGRGAIYGTAIGGGLGALTAVASKGREAVIPSGQPLNVVLDQPLTISPQGFNSAPNYNSQPSYQNQNYSNPPSYGAPPQGGGYSNGGYGSPQSGYSPYGGSPSVPPPVFNNNDY
ncbi:MAG: hypothetical protein K2X66_15670 [Cyanobacteria bacterium]|nr:hypothetical protein [Cyanobacteriota bacterium]